MEGYARANILCSVGLPTLFHLRNTSGTGGCPPHRHAQKPFQLRSLPWRRSQFFQNQHPKKCVFEIPVYFFYSCIEDNGFPNINQTVKNISEIFLFVHWFSIILKVYIQQDEKIKSASHYLLPFCLFG